jgi:GAF domain-containing protein
MTSPSNHQPNARLIPELHQWRDKFLRRILLGAVILGVFAILGTLAALVSPALLAVYIVAYIALIVAAFARMPYSIRVGFFLLIIYVIAVNNLLNLGISGSARLFLLSLIVFSGLLVSARATIYTLALSVATILVLGWLTLSGILPSPAGESVGVWITSGATFILLSVTIIIALNSFETEFERAQEHSAVALSSLQMERTQLEGRLALHAQELEEKTAHLRASTSIARISSQLDDINELMDTVVTLTAQRFQLEHVGIFLLDDRKQTAFLQAASSETGKELIQRGYRVPVDRRNALGVVAGQGRPHQSTISSETLSNRDVDFPQTRSRLVLPLLARGTMIGMMDLHSVQEQAFEPEDVEILHSLADLVAVSIENVRLLNDTRALVTQLETLTSYQSHEAWQKYAARRAAAYQYTPAGIRPLYDKSERRDGTGLQVPLILRGQSIGTITLRRKDNSVSWTERERDLVEKLASQVALALDNSRLVEEAQKSAQRDQLIAMVSGRVRETLDVDSVVRTAAMELRRIFDLREAEVSVGSLTATNAPVTGSLIGKTVRRPKSH